MEKVVLNRGELYKEHPYEPTNFESTSEFYYMHHSDGAITEVLHSIPKENFKHSDLVFVMIPGFTTILDSWEVFLQGIKKHFEIYYWESREKGTFHPPDRKIKKSDFTPDRFSLDLYEFIEATNLKDNTYILAGSSFGGTLIIDALSRQELNPHTAYLIGANIHFKIPLISKILANILPAGIMTKFKGAIRWYLRNFEVDRNTDESQYKKYVKAIELANFRYIKPTVLNYSPHPQEHLLKNIQVYTVVVGAKADKMHTIEESKFTTGEIPNAELVEFSTNKETHSEPFIDFILKKYNLRD